jgi:hypothetical protein
MVQQMRKSYGNISHRQGEFMRISGWAMACAALAATGVACNNQQTGLPTGGTGVTLGNPDSLGYVLLPGGPGQPAGVILTWAPASDPNVSNYIVLARDSTDSAATWGALAYTGADVYFDPGVFAQYKIASQDQYGDVSSGTTPVTVDTNSPVPAPAGVTGAGIDSGVKLTWSSSARLAHAQQFAYYRVYSEQATTSNNTSTCPAGAASFGLEGSTVSENFVVTGLANGAAWCYAITSVTQLGQESALSQWTIVTPSAAGGGFDVVAGNGVTVVVHKAHHVGFARIR